MPEFSYAKGRILESIAYVTGEMKEFEEEYASIKYSEYSTNTKLQKIIDRTIENILTAIIEISGAILAENTIKTESYSDVMRKIGSFFQFSDEECEILALCAVQRNRLAHRYLNFRWQVVTFYNKNKDIVTRLLKKMYEYESKK